MDKDNIENKKGIYINLKKNFVISTADGVLMNAVMGMVNPFLGVFVLSLGASNMMVGLITSLPALVNTIVFIPASKVIRRSPKKLPIVVKSALFGRLFYLLFALLIFIPIDLELKALIFVIMLGLMNVPSALTSSAWTEMIGKIFPPERRSEIMGLRNMYGGIAVMGATLLAGRLLDIIQHPYNFATIFFVSFILAMGSLVFLIRTVEPERKAVHINKGFNFRGLFSGGKQGRKFKYFCLSAFIMHFGLFMTAPVGIIYLVEQLEFTNLNLSFLTTGASFTAIAAFPIWGKIASRRGNRVVLLVAMLGFTLFAFLFTLSPLVVYLIGLHVFLGICNAAFNISIFNMVLNYTSEENKSSGIAFFNTLMNFAAFTAPFAGAYLLSIMDVSLIFMINGAIRLSSVLLLLKILNIRLLMGRERVETYNVNS